MPRLLTFLPCLKAINGDDGLLTIVSVLEYVAITVPSDQSPGANEAVQLQWQMVSVWHQDPTSSEDLQQFIEVVLPSGEIVVKIYQPLRFESRLTKLKADGSLFPIGIPGEVIIRVGYTRSGHPDENLSVQAEYPVLVVHNREHAGTV